jgi:serine/threonine protein kinase
LDTAHRQGIVHRDLKPGNIMLTPTWGIPIAGSWHAKLLDFGLAQFRVSDVAPEFISASAPLTEPTNLTLPGGILGTPQYMSPEQVECEEIDARSDIFSFGALIYEMLTGHPAFRGGSTMSILSAILRSEPEPLQQIAPDMPAELVEIIERCLRKELQQRFQDKMT